MSDTPTEQGGLFWEYAAERRGRGEFIQYLRNREDLAMVDPEKALETIRLSELGYDFPTLEGRAREALGIREGEEKSEAFQKVRQGILGIEALYRMRDNEKLRSKVLDAIAEGKSWEEFEGKADSDLKGGLEAFAKTLVGKEQEGGALSAKEVYDAIKAQYESLVKDLQQDPSVLTLDRVSVSVEDFEKLLWEKSSVVHELAKEILSNEYALLFMKSKVIDAIESKKVRREDLEQRNEAERTLEESLSKLEEILGPMEEEIQRLKGEKKEKKDSEEKTRKEGIWRIMEIGASTARKVLGINIKEKEGELTEDKVETSSPGNPLLERKKNVLERYLNLVGDSQFKKILEKTEGENIGEGEETQKTEALRLIEGFADNANKFIEEIKAAQEEWESLENKIESQRAEMAEAVFSAPKAGLDEALDKIDTERLKQQAEGVEKEVLLRAQRNVIEKLQERDIFGRLKERVPKKMREPLYEERLMRNIRNLYHPDGEERVKAAQEVFKMVELAVEPQKEGQPLRPGSELTGEAQAYVQYLLDNPDKLVEQARKIAEGVGGVIARRNPRALKELRFSKEEIEKFAALYGEEWTESIISLRKQVEKNREEINKLLKKLEEEGLIEEGRIKKAFKSFRQLLGTFGLPAAAGVAGGKLLLERGLTLAAPVGGLVALLLLLMLKVARSEE